MGWRMQQQTGIFSNEMLRIEEGSNTYLVGAGLLKIKIVLLYKVTGSGGKQTYLVGAGLPEESFFYYIFKVTVTTTCEQ